jgi:HEAT repeat protein
MKTFRANSAPIEVVIKPRGRWAMGWYIRTLLRQLKKVKPSGKWEVVEQRNAIIARLAYTCDNRIVPTLIDLLYENHHQNDVFWAKEGFVCYLPHDANIKKALLEVATTRGLASCMQSVLEAFGCSEEEFKKIIKISLSSENLDIINAAVGAAQEHPDDEHMPKLFSIATDPDRPDPNRAFYAIERHRAIYAIAYNRTDEGVKILRSLLESPSESIRETTKSAIQQAYKRHRVYPKYADDEYISELITAAKDSNHPMAINSIVGIARTRTEEGVEAIKALLENPDEGVQTIRNLLRNPDKNIRDMTEKIIRQIYRTYPGRPLRRDDFPELFREFSEKREANNKKFLERLKADN